MRDTILERLAELVWRRPIAIIVIAALLALLCGLYARSVLQVNADTNDLISPQRPFMQDFRRYMAEFGDTEYIYVVVALPTPSSTAESGGAENAEKVEKSKSTDGADDTDESKISQHQAAPLSASSAPSVESPASAVNSLRQRTEACVDALTERLRRVDGLAGVFSGVSPPEQLRLASRAMSDEHLSGLSLASGAFPALMSGDAPKSTSTDGADGTDESEISHHQAAPPSAPSAPSVEGPVLRVLRESDQLLERLFKEGAGLPEDQQQRLGAAAVFMLNAVAAAQNNSPSHAEMEFLLGDATNRKTEYFTSTSRRLYFITLMPAKDYGTLSVIEEPLRRIRAAIDEVRVQFPDVEIGLTGKPVLQADEMATTDADMTQAALLAFALCSILFMLAFASVWRPLLAVVAFAFAAAWTYGLATVAVGQLNLLSIVFILILVGVGLDYGVHVISRYREHRTRGGVQQSIAWAMLTAGRGNITGSFASAIVFFMALFTSFQGLRELGVIAGGGLLLCMASMTIVLPALLTVANRWRAGAHLADTLEAPHPEDTAAGMLRGILARPRAVVLVAAAVTVALGFAPARLRFEQNLLKLQASGLESVKWDERLADDSASNTWFGVAVADTLEQAMDFTRRAAEKPMIGEVHGILEVIQPQSPQREQWRRQLHVAFDGQPPTSEPSASDADGGAGAVPGAPAESAAMVRMLHSVTTRLDLMVPFVARKAPDEAKRFQQISADLKALQREIEEAPGEDGAMRTDARHRIERNIAGIGASLRAILDGDSLELRDALPDGIRRQFMSPRGRFAVMLHPRENVWEIEPMGRFIADLRAVDPNVTGVPITQYESLGDMGNSFALMSLLALAVIVAIVTLDFRHPRDILLALVPLGLGAIWTAEAMGLLGIAFNLANFFSVPILIGLSINGSVYVLQRYREGGPTRFTLGATRRAVIVTTLNTMIGFGGLMLAHHRGLRSLGQVMVIGTAACLLATLVILPALLVWMETSKRRNVETSK